MCVQYWTDVMARDVDQEVDEEFTRKLEEELENWQNSLDGGNALTERNWVNR